MSNDLLRVALEEAVSHLKARVQKDPAPHKAREHIYAAAQPVEAVLKQNSILPSNPERMINQGNGTLGIHPSTFAQLLVQVAAERGSQGAVDWLTKVLALQSAEVRCIALVTGLTTSAAVNFGPGFDLVPVNQLPASPRTNEMLSLCTDPMSRWFGQEASVAIVSSVTVSPFLPEASAARLLTSPKGPNDRLAPPEQYTAHEAQEKMKEVCLALTLTSNAGPTISLQWNEFADLDLAYFPTGFYWPHNEIGAASFGPTEEVDPALVPAAQAYLAMQGKDRDRFDLALRRLNQAARRRDVGDRVLDLAIAIESLLAGEGNNTEISYRFALRAALFLGADMEERREIRKCMKNFYSYRSTMVHSGSIREKPAASALQIANQATTYIRSILIKLILRGSIPTDWGDLEIGAATF